MSANLKVARVLYEIAELYSIKGEFFKSRAYRTAAQQVESLTDYIRRVCEAGRLEEIPGIGKGIGAVVKEYLNTGHSSLLEELRRLLPSGVKKLMILEGVGPKTALRLHKELGITTIEELEEAVDSGKIRSLKGFGPKSEENLQKVLKERSHSEKRFLLGQVLRVIRDIEDHMTSLDETLTVEMAGSARRMKETVGDIDIIVTTTNDEKVVEHFTSMPTITRVISKGTTRSTVIMKGELQVDLRVVPPESFGSALQYLTGSKNHNIKLRAIAAKLGFKLNEYGLFERKTMSKIAGETEGSVYEALGMTCVEPELREDTGEIESAMNGTLPELVEYKDVKGDLHVHSEWSDGTGSLEEIAEAAIKRGLRYVAVCDHSKALGIAGGLDEERLRRQMHEIEKLNRTFDDFRLLSGIEVDIMSDGSLDLRDSVLRDLDFVVASIHRGFKDTEEKMTRRIISAIHNEHVSAIGHPTGRILLRRPPYQLNLEEVLRTANEQGMLMEINAFPNRLDLNDVNSRAAKKNGVMLSIGTDAHTPAQLNYLEFGVSVARRGWLEADDVANTYELDELFTKLNK